MSRYQVAECLDAHHDSISKWEREGLPVAVRGIGGKLSRYELPAVIKWYVKRIQEQARGTAGALDLDAERAKLAREQAERIELQNRVRRGELLVVSEITAAWSDMLATLKSHLLALPVALAASVAAQAAQHGGTRAIEAVLRERITAELHELAGWRPARRGGL